MTISSLPIGFAPFLSPISGLMNREGRAHAQCSDFAWLPGVKRTGWAINRPWLRRTERGLRSSWTFHASFFFPDVAWSGRKVPAASLSLLFCERGKYPLWKAVKLVEGVRDVSSPPCQANGVALSWSRSRLDESEGGPRGGGEVALRTRVL